MLSADPDLLRGEIVTLSFDDVQVVVWWGMDDLDRSRMLVSGGLIRTWPTADTCAVEARKRGWRGLDLADSSIGRTTLDVHPVQLWLRGSLVVDSKAALDLWNIADDLARSVGTWWSTGGRIADRCYDKLVAANVPFIFGLARYQPRWSPAEVRRLREILSSAIHLLRTAIPRTRPRN